MISASITNDNTELRRIAIEVLGFWVDQTVAYDFVRYTTITVFEHLNIVRNNSAR
jgi:hypothetical protein